MALQLIDLTDNFSKGKSTNLIGNQNYIGIMEVKNISHLLKNLALNKKITSFSILNTNKQSNKLIFPSKSLQFIKNVFHP